MRLTSSSRSGSRTRLGLEELELRWQPAGLGIGLSIAALHVPDDLPVVSAVSRSGLLGSTNVDPGTHGSAIPGLATPTASASAGTGASTPAPTTITIQETFFSIEQSTSSRPVVVASTVTFVFT